MAIQLNITIVGGGVRGLACAIVPRRAGHIVTIYERHQATAQVGAGIVLQPNAALVWKQWGLDLEQAGMLRLDRGFLINSLTREVKMKIDWGNEAEINGAPPTRDYKA